MADLETLLRLRLVDRLSLRAIGQKMGLSHERIRVLLTEQGIDLSRHANTQRPSQYQTERYAPKEQDVDAIYGCTVEELMKIQGGRSLSNPRSPAFVYRSQRHRWLKDAGWQFTLPDWWAFWGHKWASRRTQHLVMVPLDPARPLGLGNVEIITRGELMARYWKIRKA